MKNRVKYEIPVGILFLIAMGILIYYTVLKSHEILKPEDTYEITVIFPNASGLEITDKVKVNGVVSGAVEKIELKNNLVWVKMVMFNKFTLYENYSIRVDSDSIMLGKQVSIFPGSKKDKNGREYAVIETRENLRGIYADPIKSFSDMIEENRPNVYAALKNIRDITEKINKGKGTMGRLINEDKLHAETGTLIKDISEAVEDAREQAPITSFIRAALTIF